ncbi:hypothetical protein LILPAPAWES_19 [Morganella phage vB_MmoP_Lilpapawes]|uniref:Uncharacterized protein n=1 Tax=Morganella phage vB_MmoP_Lilpapawes TaxID=2894803 RepID=A0AAE8YSJ1_9CAUD|nr:hypothetical protein LILPAPAWES_19 [Morganella phage vB_MmoP_Lilpapawes]
MPKQQEYTYSIERWYDKEINITWFSVKLFPQIVGRGLTEKELTDLTALLFSVNGDVPIEHPVVNDMLDEYVNITGSRI